MVQFYEVTMIFCIIIGFLIREFFINYNWSLWKWIILLFGLVVINEKTGSLEKISKWFRKSESWLYMGIIVFIFVIILILEKYLGGLI